MNAEYMVQMQKDYAERERVGRYVIVKTSVSVKIKEYISYYMMYTIMCQ